MHIRSLFRSQSSFVGACDAMLQARMGQRLYKRAQYKRTVNGELIPFNRNAPWNKRGDLPRASTGFNKVSFTTPSNQANHAFDPPTIAPPVTASLATAPPASAPPACVAPDPTPENEDIPLVLGHVTERVQETMDYVNKKHEVGQLTQEQLLAHLIRL